MYKFKLYVVGKTQKSELAVANLKELFDEQIKIKYELEIIDVLSNPEHAEQEKIIATPTLIKDLPEPVKRVIGDLCNTEKVIYGLGLIEEEAP